MLISQLFPSKYLKAADLQSKRVTVTIDKLVLEKVGPEREEKPVLIFQRATKSLILNRTNAMTIAKLYGDDAAKWGGKRIVLYATQVRAFGQNFDCVRVAAEIPPAPKPAAHNNAPTPEAADIDDAEDILDDAEVDDANPFDDSTPVAADISTPANIQPVTSWQLGEIAALGKTLHGSDWDAQRPRYADWITKGAVDSISELTAKEATALIKAMRSKITRLAAEVQSNGKH